jgi:hypothetical protein
MAGMMVTCGQGLPWVCGSTREECVGVQVLARFDISRKYVKLELNAGIGRGFHRLIKECMAGLVLGTVSARYACSSF